MSLVSIASYCLWQQDDEQSGTDLPKHTAGEEPYLLGRYLA